jgi:uncharacterized iron-regulated membrane protein
MSKRVLFYRFHIWLSWIVGLQIIIWIATGLFMALSPIETVRGEHLVRKPASVDLRTASILPAATVIARETKPVERLLLKTWMGRPTYEIHYADGRAAMVDAVSAKRLTPLTRTAAEMAAFAVYAGPGNDTITTRVDPDNIPLDFRRDEPAWAVRFIGDVVRRDGPVFYVSAETGEVLARRTPRWRLYDFMWGLHIMDYGGRTNFNTPWLAVVSALSLVSVLAGGALLFARRRWRP